MLKPIADRVRLAEPYRLFANFYDQTIGRECFELTRTVFERAVNLFDLRFSTAADLGCGTGLFARYLNTIWKVPVFGVDLSPTMLRIAANNCRGTGVTLLRQDIRRFRLPLAVDLITANFDTVNHLLGEADLSRLFRRVHRHLVPGGYFIFDFLTTCNPPSITRTYRVPLRKGVCEIFQRVRWSAPNRMFFSQMILRRGVRISMELHRERAYAPDDVAQWLMDAGLVLRGVLDTTTLSSATTCRPRVTVVAQKPCGWKQ